MHQSVINWVRDNHHALEIMPHGSILELGSLDVNGSIREYAPMPRFYVGIDLQTGPAVDVQANAWHIPFPDETFDLVISCEMLEHDLMFWKSLREARRVLRENGDIIITARGIDFPPHEHPHDYYRFTVDSMRDLLPSIGFIPKLIKPDTQCSGVLVIANKWSILTKS